MSKVTITQPEPIMPPKTVTIEMTQKEAEILCSILHNVGGMPDNNSPKVYPRGLMTNWYDGSQLQDGLLQKLLAAGIHKPDGMIALGSLTLKVTDPSINWE